MFDYLQKFNNLPKDLRDQVSSPMVMAVLSALEKKYKVDLAMTVMKVMIKDLALSNLPIYFVSQLKLDHEKAEALSREMEEKVFKAIKTKPQTPSLKQTETVKPSTKKAPVSSPSHDATTKPTLDLNHDIDVLVKEAGLMLPSEDLVSRFKNILATYIKGIRNKIDTRSTLAKNVEQGGLHLDGEQVDRVLKICDAKSFKNVNPNFKATPPLSRLDKIIHQSDQRHVQTEEYSLKKSLQEKQAKSKLDSTHELNAPAEAKEKKLPAPEEVQEKRLPAAHKIEEKNLPVIQSAKKTDDTKKTKKTLSTPLTKDVSVAPTKPMMVAKPVAVTPPTSQSITKPQKTSSKLFNRIFKADKKPVAPRKEESKASVISQPTVANRTAPKTTSRSAPAPSVSKPQVHDIKPVPKVMSPVEELKYLSLVDFRRLGKTPEEMVAKIFSKIKLLEGEGYDKMIAGVRAWRHSPVNRLYLNIGQEAINKNLSIQKAAEAREAAGNDYLNIDEIEAIIALNSKLLF